MADLLVVDDDDSMVGSLAEILSASEGHTGSDRQERRRGPSASFGSAARHPRARRGYACAIQTGGVPSDAHRDAGKERLPIVLLSGVADLRCIAALVGTPYALPKPCSLDAFLELVNRALAERTAPSPMARVAGSGG